ncbi:MAG: homoaconitase large subunit [Methanobacteriaceae archaeon]|nr:homoaconitase large subunit [Methanobacteriaceae archaeon]
MNITEKILASAAGKKEVVPGEIIEANVDMAMSHDGTSPPAIKTFYKVSKRVWDPEKIVIVFDHNFPANNIGSAEFQKVTRNFAREQGIKNIYMHGEGICHQVLPEKGFIQPGKVIVGADSHTCTYGAFGAFATGMGSTDLALVYATGKTWFMVPESIKINVNGCLSENVTSKDVILNIIGKIGADGATYNAVEYCGETIDNMGVSQRMTITNMSVEMGAKNGIIKPNPSTIDYLKKRSRSQFQIYESDEDYSYYKEFNFDVNDMEPQIACPHDVDNVKPISKVEGTHIDQVFIGSCTNGRYEDLKLASDVLKNQKVHEDVRMVIVPASAEIYAKSLADGIIQTFIDAGAMVCSPGCGPCLGGHMGVIGKGEVSLATTNRNFKGRMGDPDSEVYLSNAAVAAFSAINGEIRGH